MDQSEETSRIGAVRRRSGRPSTSSTIPIRVKMAAALAVPLLAVSTLSIAQVGRARSELARIDRETDLASIALAPGGLTEALILEQADGAATVTGQRANTELVAEDFAASAADTDRAVRRLRAATRGGGEVAADAYADILGTIDERVAAARAVVADAPTPYDLGNIDLAAEAFGLYDEILDRLSAADDRLTPQISDSQLRRAAETLARANRFRASLTFLVFQTVRGIVADALDEPATRDRVVRSLAEYERMLALVVDPGRTPWRDEAEDLASGGRYHAIADQTRAALAGEQIDVGAYLALPPPSDRADPDPGTTAAMTAAADEALTRRIDQLRSDARQSARDHLLMAILVVLGATAIAALVARSVTAPMRSLSRQARHMAEHGLPEAVHSVLETPRGADVRLPSPSPVVVRTRDEVQLVAAALNQVQATALDLGVEQATLRRNVADSLVSLGRRTQNLIGLQIDLITELEREEKDPEALEQLYRLDHLATRARRNAESLVVLADDEPGSTGGEPVALLDVVRGALSEVEEYRRVQIEEVEPVSVPSGLAQDLVHLVAELLENGLTFSPPSRPVQVHGRPTSRGYLLAVVDQGVGMEPEALASANARLAGRESFTVAPSRYLGHYVAGRLATRTGVSVELSEPAAGGVAARILIPRTLVSEAVEGASPATDASGPTAAAEPVVETVGPIDSTGSGPVVDGRPPRRPVVPATTATPDVPPAPSHTDAGLVRRVPGSALPGDRAPGGPTPAGPATGGVVGPPAEADAAARLSSLLGDYHAGMAEGRDHLDAGEESPANDPTRPETLARAASDGGPS